MKLTNYLSTTTTVLAILSASPSIGVDSHAWMTIPVSRNEYANLHGDWRSPAPGKPNKEWTAWGLNSNSNVCGSQESANYDAWLDMEGNPMPWISQAQYVEGDEIQVNFSISTHHMGHFTVSACPNGRESTQDCFDENPLEFVRDLKTGMPKDEDHPERIMLAGGVTETSYLLKLPDGLTGDKVLLQWIYWTANSCKYDGYDRYFEAHQGTIMSGSWGSYLEDCGPIKDIPIIRQGRVVPELFINCAEVTVVKGNVPDNDDDDSDNDDDTTCRDTEDKFKVGKKRRTCKWAGKEGTDIAKKCNKKLKKKVDGKKRVKDVCPVVCGNCPSVSAMPAAAESDHGIGSSTAAASPGRGGGYLRRK